MSWSDRPGSCAVVPTLDPKGNTALHDTLPITVKPIYDARKVIIELGGVERMVDVEVLTRAMSATLGIARDYANNENVWRRR